MKYDYEQNCIPDIQHIYGPLILVARHRAQPPQSCQALYQVTDRECTLDGGLSDLNTAILTVDVFGERRAP